MDLISRANQVLHATPSKICLQLTTALCQQDQHVRILHLFTVFVVQNRAAIRKLQKNTEHLAVFIVSRHFLVSTTNKATFIFMSISFTKLSLSPNLFSFFSIPNESRKPKWNTSKYRFPYLKVVLGEVLIRRRQALNFPKSDSIS